MQSDTTLFALFEASFVDDPQPVQRQHLVYCGDVLRSPRDELGESTGCDRLCLRAKFTDHPLQNPIHKSDVTVVQADL